MESSYFYCILFFSQFVLFGVYAIVKHCLPEHLHSIRGDWNRFPEVALHIAQIVDAFSVQSTPLLMGAN